MMQAQGTVAFQIVLLELNLEKYSFRSQYQKPSANHA